MRPRASVSFQYTYYAGNKRAFRQVDRTSISHSDDVRSQLNHEGLLASSWGVSSWTVGGSLSRTETDGDIDDWDIALRLLAAVDVVVVACHE